MRWRAQPRRHRGQSILSARSDELTVRGFLSRIASELRRGEYFAGLFILGCTSGLIARILHSVMAVGWMDALFRTFDISVIIWVSCIAGVLLINRDQTLGVRPFEIALGAGLVVLVILPIGPLSWIGVTVLSVYILVSTEVTTSRRGASILLAATVPMLWSRALFDFFADFILAADASLVSWLIGTRRTGNLVEFADNSGQLVIFPACSSLANVSVAILCWVTFSELVSHKKSGQDFLWCFLSCLAVVAVNVSRMAILGLSEDNYLNFHNQWGDAAVNVIMLGLIVGITALGLRRELFQRS
jgi:exosortase/archaeosortase family protein